MIGSEGQDWFGTDMRLRESMVGTDWGVLSERRRVFDVLQEWQGLVDPATGDLYYLSRVTGASLWEKRNEVLRAEAEMRRMSVARLDNELRGEEMFLRNQMRGLRRNRCVCFRVA